MFPLISDFDSNGEVTSDLFINHLIVLKEKIKEYFPSACWWICWVRNPFTVISEALSHQGLVEQEELLES